MTCIFHVVSMVLACYVAHGRRTISYLESVLAGDRYKYYIPHSAQLGVIAQRMNHPQNRFHVRFFALCTTRPRQLRHCRKHNTQM